MTFNFAPWAIDGARTTSATARVATYANSGGQSGVVRPTDLRVLPLAVPGNGIRITSGSASILNHYLDVPDESYVAPNPATHTVLPQDMPAPIPTVGYYLVCVVVGDPEFDQSEHPFMPSTPIPPEQAADFQYVRVVIVPCSADTTRFEQLGLHYPAYALARLEIPANTTTITAAMITDLRKLAQPRSDRDVLMNVPTSFEHLTSETYVDWISYKPFVEVPIWATSVRVTVTLAGIVAFNEAIGGLRAVVGPIVGAELGYDVNDNGTGERRTSVLAVGGDVSALAGQTLQLKVQGWRRGDFTGYLSTWVDSQVVYDVQFDERPL